MSRFENDTLMRDEATPVSAQSDRVVLSPQAPLSFLADYPSGGAAEFSAALAKRETRGC